MLSSAKRKKLKKSIRYHALAVTIMIPFCIYFMFSVVATQLKIFNKQQELNQIEMSIKYQQEANDEIYRIISGSDDTANYIEKIAREKLGYARAGERVFVDVAGIGD